VFNAIAEWVIVGTPLYFFVGIYIGGNLATPRFQKWVDARTDSPRVRNDGPGS